jgi:uncharacterized protein YbbK (DUF523 family)
MILVSACLLGQSTRYDGGHCLEPELWVHLQRQPYMALCPEVMGGLGIPRPPAHFQGAARGKEGAEVLAGRARLITEDGRDVSDAFIEGARRVLAAAKAAGVTKALLKDRSPSCAWDPLGENPQGGPGLGVLTALLKSHGIEVVEIRADASNRTAPSAGNKV